MCDSPGRRGMTGKHGNQRRGRKTEYVSVSCRVCGVVREYRQGEFKRRPNLKFCSKTCAAKARSFEGSRVKIVCAVCKKEVLKRRDHIKKENFCSPKCAQERLRKIHLLRHHGAENAKAFWKDKSCISEYHREYRKKNRERINKLSAEWGKKNREKKNANLRARRGSGGKVSAEKWREICDSYGGRCLSCLEISKLTLDHIIPVSLGGTTYEENVQPLCGRCNAKKGAKTIDFRPTFIERMKSIHGIEIREFREEKSNARSPR